MVFKESHGVDGGVCVVFEVAYFLLENENVCHFCFGSE